MIGSFAWLADYSGPAAFLALYTGVGYLVVDKALKAALDKSLALQRQEHERDVQKRQQLHADELERFKQAFQSMENERAQAFAKVMETDRHGFARALEAAKVRMSREEQWIRKEIDALVDLNEVFLSLTPDPTNPHPELTDVYDSVRATAPKHLEQVKALLRKHDVFLPDTVREAVHEAQVQLRFCRFEPADEPHVEGDGEGAYEALQQAVILLREHVRGRLREERSTL